MSLPKLKPRTFFYRDRKNIDKPTLLRSLGEGDWERFYSEDSIDSKVGLLVEIITSSFDKVAPYKQVTLKKHKLEWLTPDIKELMRKRDTIRARYRKTGGVNLREKFSMFRKLVKREIYKVKSNYYFRKLEGPQDAKKLWSQLRDLGLIEGNLNKGPNPAINLNEHLVFRCHWEET